MYITCWVKKVLIFKWMLIKIQNTTKHGDRDVISERNVQTLKQKLKRDANNKSTFISESTRNSLMLPFNNINMW